MPRVNPEILRWAREAAGLDRAEAARKVGLGAAFGLTPTERLEALERGEFQPSRAQLSKAAAAYRRPLLTFYLAAPPAPAAPIEDFRTLPDRSPEAEPLVQALVRDVRTRQALVRELLEDDEALEVGFVGSLSLDQGASATAERLARSIGFDLPRFRAAPGTDQAFAYLRELVEAAGVFVLLIGDLGSHHTEIDTDAFRGFALADRLAPFVVINDRDAHAAWSFTLLHELVHIGLGVSGVSGAHPASQVERFCNDVASRVLLPAPDAEQIQIDAAAPLADLAEQIGRAAASRRLSRTLIAFRLFHAGVIDDERWEALRAHFADEWRASRAAKRNDRSPDGGGPSYYVVRRQRLGRALVDLVSRAVSAGTLSPTKAGKVLGVKPRSVEPLIRGAAA